MNAAALLRVTGLVQGVGYRPFVHRLATRHGLGGWVRNTASAVEIAVEGAPSDVDAFVRGLHRAAPPLARVDRVARSERPLEGLRRFDIELTQHGTSSQPVPPDIAVCAACERELADPGNRRYRFPFITCTDCGPRFTVIEGMPYDRMRTSMRAFPMCPRCQAEYRDPADRRFHSETNACPDCGPRLWLCAPDGAPLAEGADAALEASARIIEDGGIVALRGLGGFHLAVDATCDAAVRRLRQRKRREAKPFAVMVASLAVARRLAWLSDEDEALLSAPERPIVLVRSKRGEALAASVVPELRDVGLMLPATALHHLLLRRLDRPLVMTSGNLADEPIAADNLEARDRLGGVADAFLLHDREIVARCDDSVIRSKNGSFVTIRRARGYVPLPLPLPIAVPETVIAVGPHLKNTLTLASGSRAWVSQHIGDLEDVVALEHFHAVLESFRRLFDLHPAVAVRDLHPSYLSTRIAAQLSLGRVIAVQHHHAHIAAVAAEHGYTDPVLGLACDGTGYGDDGTVWGSELLAVSGHAYRRLGHLVPAPLPGGDVAARRPWRSALGYLSLAPDLAPSFSLASLAIHHAEREAAQAQLRAGLNSPLASSMGRLFDAAAAVIGVCRLSRYEGHAAMLLESLAGRRAGTVVAPRLVERQGRWQVDPLPLLAELGRRAGAGDDARDLAAAFHDSIAAALIELARRAAASEDLRTIVLSGGSFQNLRLLATVRGGLERRGLRVLVPLRLPPNDGAISYGQAAVAAAILASEGAS